METGLEHEDLLIKLRAKLNEEKIKLWEPPFVSDDGGVSQSLKVIKLGNPQCPVSSFHFFTGSD